MTGDMSTNRGLSTPGHAAFDELAVGYALDALEPGEEAVLVKHLPSCRRCQDSVAAHREIAAELALGYDDGGPDVPVSAALAEAMASQPHRLPADPFVPDAGQPVADRVPVQPSGRPTVAVRDTPTAAAPGRPRFARQARRVLVGAGALGIVTAVTLSAYDVHLRRHTPVSGQSALTALADPQATIAHLAGPGASATAVVADGHAWLVSTGLSHTSANTSYVVWDTSGPTAKPLAGFTAGSEAPQVVDLGAAPTSHEAYAVTKEPEPLRAALPSKPHGQTVLTEASEPPMTVTQ